VGDAICELISLGKSLLKICESSEFPAQSTVYRWIESNDDFREKYARARELQADYYSAEIIDLADKERICQKRVIKADGSEELTILDQTDRTRLQIDARKWYASKLAPKKYGDKVQQEVSGPGGEPIQAQITVQFVKSKSE
jgi:hypothetical protein